MAHAVASRYAKALADLVLRPGSGLDPRAVARQLEAFEETLAASEELRNALLSPAVPPPRKRAIVSRLTRDLALPKLIGNFLFVLMDHRRVALVGEVRQAFESLVDARMGVVKANVASARVLSGDERAALVAELARLTGSQVRCEFSTDAELVGGVTARIGSRIYDGSVRGQLNALQRALTT